MSGTPFPPAYPGGSPSLSQNAEAQLIIRGVGLVDTVSDTFGTGNGVSFNDCIGNPYCTQGAGFLTTLTDSSATGGIDEDGTYTAQLNEIYTVALNEYLLCNGAIFSCSVSVDPIITVPAGDELLISQGFGNGAPVSKVPEPGTLGLLGVAIAGIVAVRRRKGAHNR